MNNILIKEKQRETFSSKFGFIISSIGAALGLGNIWMFSYRLGAYGGAAFLLPYFLFVFLLGTTGLITEFTFGRKFKAGSLTGIKTIFKSKKLKGANLFGFIPVVGVTGILIFYSVVIGWILKYFTISLTGEISTINPEIFFDSFAGTSNSIPWLFLSLILTFIIVSLGISKGIEKLNKILIPGLLIIFIILAIRSLTLPGAMEGVKYILTPRWESLFNIKTWIMALGQAFFTVSLNGCGMVVYGSYAKDDFDIVSSSLNTAFFDTIAALLAALVIMPAVFAFNLDPTSGPSLLFITLPKVFNSMSHGNLISSLFFLSVIFAAISSSINMLEGPVEAIISSSKLSRKKASFIVVIICFILAIPLAMDTNKFSNFADFITIVLSPTGAMVIAILSFFFLNKDFLTEVNKGSQKTLGKWFLIFGKTIFVPVTIVVIILGIIYRGIG